MSQQDIAHSQDVFSASYVPQTPGGAQLHSILPNYKDQSACATKLLEILKQISAKKTALQHSQAKEPKTFSIPVEDFKGILDLARQNKHNTETGNWIATQIAMLTEDIHNHFDKLEQDVSALSSIPASTQPTTYSQALASNKSPATTGHPKSHPSNLVYPTTLFPELKQLADTAIESASIVGPDGKPLKMLTASILTPTGSLSSAKNSHSISLSLLS
ncbi:hypothetical protein BS47DRAFT_1400951 [Hydnum rufescens UP504]|uniref:Uncharacterized protein n=1 Tax=Hydnum rufescens UP504 TaxID=1448309 RepID=A0A9P6DN24_9AGAM|nr:hypothetical protein BS47DRAFT_1400951 [Hydnum rufescens UP504]